MRVGQKNKLTYRWARKGSHPHSEAMELHLDEIATKVTSGAHAIVLLDQAGWRGPKVLKVPSNISLMSLPPCARTQRPGKQSGLQILRRYRRSLLLRLEYAHRSGIASRSACLCPNSTRIVFRPSRPIGGRGISAKDRVEGNDGPCGSLRGGERPRCIGAGPEIGSTDPTGRSGGRDPALQWLGLRRSQHHFRSSPALVRATVDTRNKQHDRSSC